MPRPPLNERKIVYAIGAPEQGKSSYIAAAIAEEPRVLAWLPASGDVDCNGCIVRSAADLLAAIQAAGEGPALIQYVPRYELRREFESFCIGAMGWGELGDVAVLVEELADVSTIGKASPHWGRVLRECRHFHLRIFSTTQRPQEADKTILGIYSTLAVFWLPDADDRLYIARKTQLPMEQLDTLQRLQYLESEGRGQYVRGRLTFA